MKIKSFANLFSILIVLSLVLAACSSAPAAEAPAADAPAAEEAAAEAPAAEEMTEDQEAVQGLLPAIIDWPDQIADGEEVTVLVVEMPSESNPEAVAAWEEQVDRFEAMYPNVTIEGTDYAYAPDSFAALVAGDQVPTLFEVYLTDPAKMIEQGVAADITDIIKAQKLDEVFNPDILGIAEQDGKYYGLPRFAYAMGLAYNIQMLNDAGFDAPPATWDELATMAQALTDRDNGVAGFSFITDGSGAAGWHMTTLAYNFGLDNEEIVSKDGDSYTANFADGAMLDALNYVHDLRWTYDVLPLENLAWDTNGEALASSRAAMIVMAGDQFTWIRQTYTDAPIDDFGFAPMPYAEGSQSTSLVGGNIAMISASATEGEMEAALYWRLFTQFDPDEIIANYESGKTDPTVVVGSPTLPLYVGDYEAAVEATMLAYANMPVENYATFLTAISSGEATMQPEPIIAGQEFYSAMGTAVSTVVAEEGTDSAELLASTAKTFQENVLDLLE